MTNTALLEVYIDNSGYKRSFIAKALGITAYALALKINNKSEFKANEIDILCKLLKIGIKDRMRIFFAQ
ncbi:MAG: toxin-antitoxin system, antitoxin component, Xre family protein [Clostridia bacterium]|nr:toxin-antitoxin system, antitoxin component, Xre family protein [Clostridia bacterium]